jgi:hypothetical protein
MYGIRTWAAAIPALAVAAGAAALVGSALAGSGELPEQARSLTAPPKGADLVAPAPEGLSTISVTRDWQEVATSGSTRPPR